MRFTSPAVFPESTEVFVAVVRERAIGNRTYKPSSIELACQHYHIVVVKIDEDGPVKTITTGAALPS